MEGVRVDADEQVSLRIPRAAIALFQRDEIVAIADQHGAEAALRIDLARQFPRHGQSDVFLTRSTGTHGARVFTAMPGVDGNDHITIHGGYRLLDRSRDRRCRGSRCRQIDHQSMTMPLGGRKQKRLRSRRNDFGRAASFRSSTIRKSRSPCLPVRT